MVEGGMSAAAGGVVADARPVAGAAAVASPAAPNLEPPAGEETEVQGWPAAEQEAVAASPAVPCLVPPTGVKAKAGDAGGPKSASLLDGRRRTGAGSGSAASRAHRRAQRQARARTWARERPWGGLGRALGSGLAGQLVSGEGLGGS